MRILGVLFWGGLIVAVRVAFFLDGEAFELAGILFSRTQLIAGALSTALLAFSIRRFLLEREAGRRSSFWISTAGALSGVAVVAIVVVANGQLPEAPAITEELQPTAEEAAPVVTTTTAIPAEQTMSGAIFPSLASCQDRKTSGGACFEVANGWVWQTGTPTTWTVETGLAITDLCVSFMEGAGYLSTNCPSLVELARDTLNCDPEPATLFLGDFVEKLPEYRAATDDDRSTLVEEYARDATCWGADFRP